MKSKLASLLTEGLVAFSLVPVLCVVAGFTQTKSDSTTVAPADTTKQSAQMPEKSDTLRVSLRDLLRSIEQQEAPLREQLIALEAIRQEYQKLFEAGLDTIPRIVSRQARKGR